MITKDIYDSKNPGFEFNNMLKFLENTLQVTKPLHFPVSRIFLIQVIKSEKLPF
jgi:hypothetical protein